MLTRWSSLRMAVAAAAICLGWNSTASAGFVIVQPIQVRADDGSNGAPVGYFEQATNQVWHQAGIEVQFLPLVALDDSRFLTVELSSATDFNNLISSRGHGQNADPLVLNMWFIDQFLVNGEPSATVGFGFVGGNGIAIASDVFGATSGRPLPLTIAHEIGHNLGLSHPLIDNDPLNLMAATGVSIALADVYPNGEQYGALTQEQVDLALQSRFVRSQSPLSVPAPSTVLLTAIGGAVVLIRRRRIG